MTKPTRLIADPTQVRVSIRRVDKNCWCASVTHRETGRVTCVVMQSPSKAVWRALCNAEKMNMKGINLYMDESCEAV